MVSPPPPHSSEPSVSLFEGQEINSPPSNSTNNHDNIDRSLSEDTVTPFPPTSSQKLHRSHSIQDQLNRPPKVNPAQWGHSISKSYGGNDWPLPATGNNPNSPTFSSGTAENGRTMEFTALSNDQLWPAQNAPKKRGPKPKNEPATTRRQQLNRIAQRAHRDRKEMYIKNLEVRRFRQAYAIALSERQKLIEENRLLREEVAAFRAISGLPAEDIVIPQATFLPPPQPVLFPTQVPLIPPQPQRPQSGSASPRGFSKVFSKLKRKESQTVGLRISPPLQSLSEFESPESAGTQFQAQVLSGQQQQTYPPSPLHGSQSSGSPPQSGHSRTMSNATMSTLQSQGMEQPLAAVALAFIVRLESVCMDHLHVANQSDLDPESAPHGHALMGSALSYVSSPSSFGTTSTPNGSSISNANTPPAPTTMDQRTLEILLNLNFQTNNGEYINTMGGQIYGSISMLDAWNLVCSHKRFGKFDVEVLANKLAPLVECKGYGPTVEAEEVLKAIEEITSGQMYTRF